MDLFDFSSNYYNLTNRALVHLFHDVPKHEVEDQRCTLCGYGPLSTNEKMKQHLEICMTGMLLPGHCILCGDGPFSSANLAEHFDQCFEDHCPTENTNKGMGESGLSVNNKSIRGNESYLSSSPMTA